VVFAYAPTKDHLEKIEAKEKFQEFPYSQLSQRPNFRPYFNSRGSLVSKRALSAIGSPPK